MRIKNYIKKHPRTSLAITMLGGSILAVAALYELIGITMTGYFNPKNQWKCFDQEAERQLNEEEKYNELYKTFIDHADQDKNGYITMEEQAEAWRKLGFQGPFFESEGKVQFPKPDLTQLEKAIETYKQK